MTPAERQRRHRGSPAPDQRQQEIETLKAMIASLEAVIARQAAEIAALRAGPRPVKKPQASPRPKAFMRPFKLLAVYPSQQLSERLVRDLYRQASKQHHPDAGGTAAAMTRLNWERELAMRWAKGERSAGIGKAPPWPP